MKQVLILLTLLTLAASDLYANEKPYTYNEQVCIKLEEKIEDRIFLVINETLSANPNNLDELQELLDKTRKVYETECLAGFDDVSRPE